MIARIGFAVGTLVALGVPVPAFAQDAPPLQRPDVTFTGSARLDYAARDGALEALRAAVSGVPPPDGDDTFLSAESRLRLDVHLDRVRAVAELATLPYDDGLNLPLGSGSGPDVLLKQIFLDLEALSGDDVRVRVGAFDYAWRIRPHGEPFVLDLGRAESFLSGPGARDVELPGGVLATWRAHEFLQVEALWVTTIEGGPASADESAGALLANFPLSERSAVFVGFFHVAGGGREQVSTLGGGADSYFGAERELEVFGEAWIQRGKIDDGVRSRAWAGQAGARWVDGPWEAEVSASWRSGDSDPSDGRDGTFRSYEGQERFRVVESAEFGLDWDENLAAFKVRASRRFGDVEVRLDGARFRLLKSPGGGLDRNLGFEVDAVVKLDVSAAASVWLGAAVLAGSDTLESLPDGDSSAGLITAGARVVF